MSGVLNLSVSAGRKPLIHDFTSNDCSASAFFADDPMQILFESSLNAGLTLNRTNILATTGFSRNVYLLAQCQSPVTAVLSIMLSSNEAIIHLQINKC